ncbi:MAG: penicillin acylase family protein [Polyangiaceae bacterium]
MRTATLLAAASLAACLSAGCGGEEQAPSPPIRVTVDTHGIPHISAATDDDLFYGYGYQLASDRMLQLEMWRRFALGRRSEILGGNYPGSFGATTLQDDELVRMFDVVTWGKLDAAKMRSEDPEHWRLIQRWREGINARVREIRSGAVDRPFGFEEDELDFLPEPWDEDDPVIVMKMIHLGLDQTILYEILVSLLDQLSPDALAAIQLFKPGRPVYQVPPEDMPAGAGGSKSPPPSSPKPAGKRLDRLPPGALDPTKWSLPTGSHPGSNSWVVDGRFTENGKPMLAGDPHLVFTLMGCMYAVHLDSKSRGGTFDVGGFSFVPGMGIFAGRNEDIAWTPTSAFGDVMDLWSAEIDDKGAHLGGQIVPVVTRDEIIHDREGNDTAVEFVDVPGVGVLFQGSFSGVPISVAGPGKEAIIGWTGFSARSSKYFLELDRATSTKDFEDAVDRVPELSYNWVAADRQSITYRVSLEVPKRNPIAKGREPWRVMDGSDPLALWPGGALPASQLPRGHAEERGFIVTANNDPFGFTDNGILDDDPWYYGAFFDPGYRAGRIDSELSRLTTMKKVTLADMQALQDDVHSNLSDDALPLLDHALAARATDPALAEYVDRPDFDVLAQLLIGSWDGRMARDSSGALAFHAFVHFLAGEVLEDDMVTLLYERTLQEAPFYVLKVAMLALQGAYPDGAKVVQGGNDLVILRALDKTAAFLQERFGGVSPEKYRYSDMRVTDFDNAYGLGMPIGQWPTDGGEDTVNVAHGIFRKNKKVPEKWVSNYGPVERMTARFDDAGHPELWVNFPLGNVADPASPHWNDQLEGWTEGTSFRFPFTEAEIAAEAERTFEIPPPEQLTR